MGTHSYNSHMTMGTSYRKQLSQSTPLLNFASNCNSNYLSIQSTRVALLLIRIPVRVVEVEMLVRNNCCVYRLSRHVCPRTVAMLL